MLNDQYQCVLLVNQGADGVIGETGDEGKRGPSVSKYGEIFEHIQNMIGRS